VTRKAQIGAGACLLLITLAVYHSYPHPQGADFAYIGPGAGFAFLGSFLTLLGGFFLSMVSLLTWPFRMLWRLIILGKYSWTKSIAAALVINALFFFMFEVWFKVPLFKGSLDPLRFLGY